MRLIDMILLHADITTHNFWPIELPLSANFLADILKIKAHVITPLIEVLHQLYWGHLKLQVHNSLFIAML